MRNLLAILLVGLLLITTGCSGSKKKTKSQREEATLQWNRARASLLVSLASDQYNAGNIEKCKDTVTQALRMDPTNPRLHVLAAKVAIEQSELELAQRFCEQAR